MFGADYETLDDAEDNLLKDTDLFKEEVKRGEVPELRDDVKIIATIESDIKSIQYLIEDIHTSGGMSQSLAMEAARYSDRIKDTPIQFFTEEPTLTLKQVSVESLLDSIKNGFKKLIEAIKNFIRRAVAWLVGLFKKDISDRDYERAKQKLDIQEEKNLDAWKTIIESLKRCNHYASSVSDHNNYLSVLAANKDIPLEALIAMDLEHFVRPNQYVNKALIEKDPFIIDIVFMGPYTRLMKSIADSLRSVSDDINQKIRDVNTLVENERNEIRKVSSYLQPSRFVSKYFNAPIQIFIGGEHRGEYTLDKALMIINNDRAKAQRANLDQEITYRDLLIRTMVNVEDINPEHMQSELTRTMKSLVEAEAQIDGFYSLIDSIIVGDGYKKNNNELISSLRMGVTKLSIELNNITIICRYIKSYLDLLYFLTKDIVHYTDNIIEWIAVNGDDKAEIKPPKEIVEFVAKIGRERRTTYLNIKNYNLGG